MNHAKRANTVLVFEWIFFLLPIVALAIGIGLSHEKIEREFRYEPTTAIIYAVVITISLLIGLLLNILLTHGVDKGNSTSLKVWAVIAIVPTGLYVISTILFLIGGVSALVQSSSRGILFPLLLGLGIRVAVLAYKIWSILVILEFRRELTTSSAAFDGEGGVVYSFPATPKP